MMIWWHAPRITILIRILLHAGRQMCTWIMHSNGQINQILSKYYQPPDASFSFPVAWHLDDPVKIDSYNLSISFFLAAAVGTLQLD